MLLNIACSFFLVFFTSTIVKMKLHSSDTRKNSQPKPRPTILQLLYSVSEHTLTMPNQERFTWAKHQLEVSVSNDRRLWLLTSHFFIQLVLYWSVSSCSEQHSSEGHLDSSPPDNSGALHCILCCCWWKKESMWSRISECHSWLILWCGWWTDDWWGVPVQCVCHCVR